MNWCDEGLLKTTKMAITDDFHICPVCGYRGKFDEYGTEKKRKNALCPDCGSLERTRLYYIYLRSVGVGNNLNNVIHINPEQCIRSKFTKDRIIQYRIYGLKDVDSLNDVDNNIDCIIANNIIDRTTNDLNTLSMMNKLLVADGFAMITVNIYGENSDLESMPRKYGKDFIERVNEIGFETKIISGYELIGPSLAFIYGIGSNDYLIVAYKHE